MDYKSQLDQHKQLFSCFADLPGKMLSMHYQENLAEFVLYTLCRPDCFNISKAAYFVDNPDFDTLIGIAGFDKCLNTEEFKERNSHWDMPDQFSQYMCSCDFNKEVRQIKKSSNKKPGPNQIPEKEMVADLSKTLSFNSPGSYSWQTKHDNHGLLVFEMQGNSLSEDLLKAVCILSFSPIF